MPPKGAQHSGQGGQSLAEFILCLPLVLLMLFGLVQLGLLAAATCFSHYAAGCALRAYTVHYARDAEGALRRAGQAMQQALAWGPPLSGLRLSIEEERPEQGALAGAKYQGDGPLLFTATLSAELPFILPFGPGHGASIRVRSSMLSEKTRDAS